MSGCIKENTGVSCGGTGGGSTPSNIVPPTAAGQIPVSEQDITSGEYKYVPKTNPLASITQSDAGRALFVNSAGDGFTTEEAVIDNDALESLLDQTGVIGYPELTFTSPNILKVPNLRVVFKGTVPGVDPIVDIPATDVTITGAGSGQATSDFTYVSVTPAGQFLQNTAPPTGQDRIDNVFVCEVYHPNGGPIKSVRPFWSFYGNNQEVSQEIGRILGLVDRGFAFTRVAAQGSLLQVGPDARVLGYNIEATGDDRNIKKFPTGQVTAEYFSFDPAERVPALTNFNKAYKLDSPLGGTAQTLTNFGILVLFAGVDGSYFIMAPQQNFANLDDAVAQRTTYAASITLPEGLLSFYVAVATIVVSPNVTATTGTFIPAAIGDAALVGGSSVVSGPTLPDPTTGQPGDVVVVNAATDAYELQSDSVPDLTGVADGSFLVVQGSQIVPQQLNAANIDFFFKRQDMRFLIIEFNKNFTVAGTSGDVSFFNVPGILLQNISPGVYVLTLPRSASTSPIAVWNCTLSLYDLSIVSILYVAFHLNLMPGQASGTYVNSSVLPADRIPGSIEKYVITLFFMAN